MRFGGDQRTDSARPKSIGAWRTVLCAVVVLAGAARAAGQDGDDAASVREALNAALTARGEAARPHVVSIWDSPWCNLEAISVDVSRDETGAAAGATVEGTSVGDTAARAAVRVVFGAPAAGRLWTRTEAAALRTLCAGIAAGKLGTAMPRVDLFVALAPSLVVPFEDLLRADALAGPGAPPTPGLAPTPYPPLLVPRDAPWAIVGIEPQHAGRAVAVGASHGLYLDDATGRWSWQRPALFTTVEDLLSWSIVHPFLVPMLEGAGLRVETPRARDANPHVVEIAATAGEADGLVRERGEWTGAGGGLVSNAPDARLVVVPRIPEAGRYSVALEWPTMADLARVRGTVRHAAGEDRFEIDQRLAAGRPHHLGTWWFEAGRDASVAAIVLEPFADDAATTRTAVGFLHAYLGGGTGRAPDAPPAWHEAARYCLERHGAPVAALWGDEANDYRRDIILRGEFANWLASGGAPVEAWVTLHTDAGIGADGLIGTLGLYRVADAAGGTTFPDGRPRLLSRALGHFVCGQVVADLRALASPQWMRRAVADRDYGEVRRPNVPGVIVELLAHQNFNDMRYGLDPRFRFDAARAIMKGMLRFLATTRGEEAIVPPLPPLAVEARCTPAGVVVRWRAEVDPLEPTAVPDAYVVQRSRDGRAFDAGRAVSGAAAMAGAPEWLDRAPFAGGWTHYRVLAVNGGGASMPSPVVAAHWLAGLPDRTLEVTGFLAAGAPPVVDEPGRRGFVVDDAMARAAMDPAFLGAQVDAEPGAPFRTNAEPGWGRSLSDPAVAAARRAMPPRDWSVLYSARDAAPPEEGRAVDGMTRWWFDALDEPAVEGYRGVRYLGGEHVVATPPSLTTGEALVRWRAARPPLLTARGAALLDAAAESGATVEVFSPARSAPLVLRPADPRADRVAALAAVPGGS